MWPESAPQSRLPRRRLPNTSREHITKNNLFNRIRFNTSSRYSLTHRDELIDELMRAETRTEVGLGRDLLDRYLAMYANDDTLAYPDDARRAVEELLRRGQAAGHLAASGVEWAP